MAIFVVAILLFSSFVGIGSEEKQNKNPVAIIVASSNVEAIGVAITFRWDRSKQNRYLYSNYISNNTR